MNKNLAMMIFALIEAMALFLGVGGLLRLLDVSNVWVLNSLAIVISAVLGWVISKYVILSGNRSVGKRIGLAIGAVLLSLFASIQIGLSAFSHVMRGY